MTVSDLLLKVLRSFGVRHLFGIPGDAINDVMDAIRRQDAIDFIQVKHEETGAFAASAQAKLTGRLAACVGTAGPGAIHLLNGLYDAKLDHAPVLAVTGQVTTDFIGTAHHQEVNLERLFADVAVYSQTVVTEDQLPSVFLEACQAAVTARGVAHVSIPTDISGRRVSASDDAISAFSLPESVLPARSACQKAIELIDSSQRPVILAGIGCASAVQELCALADRIGAPIVRTLRAKEVIDDAHEMCIGGLGLLGGRPGVEAMENCDLLILAGTDFPYREFYPSKAKVIQIDIDPQQIGKRCRIDVALAGDATATLEYLAGTCREKTGRQFLESMQSSMQRWRRKQADPELSDAKPILTPRVIRELSDIAPNDAIFICDTGTATAWTARHLQVRTGQRYTLSGGLASMAFALPGAIGAQLAYPERRVFSIAGDGGFAMLIADLATAVRYNLPVVFIVLNNAKLAFIALEQEAQGLPDYGTAITNPKFPALAHAFGARAISVTEPDEINSALNTALSETDKPTVIDIEVDPDQLIFPPRVHLHDALNFGLAKVREALGAGNK